MPSSRDGSAAPEGAIDSDRLVGSLKRRSDSNRTDSRHDLLKAWIAAILWLIVISVESTSLLSAHNTSRILYPLLHYLFGMAPENFEDLHFFIRKGGHIVGYAILSILLFRAWRATLPTAGNTKWAWRWATIAFFGTAIVASLDEWHQSFLPSRTGRWEDVVLDTCAAMGAQIILFVWAKRFQSR